jgi:hypothetical protein
MSTVGSASATGSGGNTTTWASGSIKGTEGEDGEDTDKMSVDTNSAYERDRYSTMGQSEDGDGMSDEGNASLVGFGEGAGSTMSGPTYTRTRSGLGPGSQIGGQGLGNQGYGGGSPASTATGAVEQRLAAQRLGPVADDSGSGFVDTSTRSPVPVSSRGSGAGAETAERIMKDRLDDGEKKGPALGTPDESNLGKFYFEDKK